MSNAMSHTTKPHDATTALNDHSLAGYTKPRHMKRIRKNIRLGSIWCLIRHIPKRVAEIVTAQGFGRSELSLGWCLRKGLVAPDTSTEVPAELGQAQKYKDGGLGRGDCENP